MESASRFILHFNCNAQVLGGQSRFHPIRPFHEADAVPREVFCSAQFRELALGTEAIGVEVVDRKAGFVLLNEHECGAVHGGRVLDTEPLRDGANEVGLSRAERPSEGNNIAGTESFAEAPPEGFRCRQIRDLERESVHASVLSLWNVEAVRAGRMSGR